MAKERYQIRYDLGAMDDMQKLRSYDLRRLFDAIGEQLTITPDAPSRLRKCLEGINLPWSESLMVWQLRVQEFRVFYDVDSVERQVIVRAVRLKGRSTTEAIL